MTYIFLKLLNTYTIILSFFRVEYIFEEQKCRAEVVSTSAVSATGLGRKISKISWKNMEKSSENFFLKWIGILNTMYLKTFVLGTSLTQTII